MYYNTRNLIRCMILVVIITLILLFLIFFKLLQVSNDFDNKIASSGWPAEIPILKNESMEIVEYDNFNEQNCISWTNLIRDGLSYDEFRKYLLKLDDIGFEPIKEKGSKSPKLLNMNPIIDEDFIVIWYGQMDDYYVEAYWQYVNYENSESDNIKYVSRILLSKKVDNVSNNFIDRKTEIMSGEVTFVSGDLNATGEILTQN